MSFLFFVCFFYFFFNDTATTEIYTLSLHDALPIYAFVEVVPEGEKLRVFGVHLSAVLAAWTEQRRMLELRALLRDRKSTRLNSSHGYISYAVFCLKKKKKHIN